jgi:hypothetical protein
MERRIYYYLLFLSPLNIHRSRLILNPRTLVPMAKTLTTVTAVCLRPRFPLLHFPFPVTHVVYVFPGFLPSPVPAFLGSQQTFLLVICRSALPRDAVFFRSQNCGWGFSYFGFGNLVCLFWASVSWCSIAFCYSGILRSEGHFWRPKVLYGLSMCCVCTVPMVSHVIHS